MIQNIEWDSQHFNMNVGSYNVPTKLFNFDLESLLREAKACHYDVVYVRSKSPIIELDNKHTFRDERIVYAKENSRITPHLWLQEQKQDCISIGSRKNKQISKELIQLALASGEYSRYKLDERFNRECFEKLYKDWIGNSVYDDFATDVLVASFNGKDVGLLTYKVTGTTAIIGILAVESTYRGLHIGKHLMQCYHEALPPEIASLKVVTQGANHIARRFYESCGYSIEDTSYTYHLWI